MQRLFWVYYEEIFWILEKWSGKIWRKFCPDNKVSYYLDFLPAFMIRHRYKGQNKRTDIDNKNAKLHKNKK